MATDARISTSLPGHPKTRKLLRKLGPAGAWSLVCLFTWTAANRSHGDLSGMSVEDLELAADWQGEEGLFVSTLVAVRFLDGATGEYRIHDWADHQPWAAGADMRSAKARWNAVKRHHGEAEADRQVPEYAATRRAPSNADSTAASSPASNAPSNAGSNAPSPSPSPSPTPTYEQPSSPKPAKAESPLFDEFWRTYPKKVGKDAARKAFERRKVTPEVLAQMLAAVSVQRATSQWQRDAGQYIPHPSTWLNEGRWHDEAGEASTQWATRGVAL